MSLNSKLLKTLVLMALAFLAFGIYYSAFKKDKVVYNETSQSINKPEEDKTSNWKTHANETYGISYKYPSNYKLEEVNLDEGTIAYMSVLTNSEKELDKDVKIWDVMGIHVGVRRKMGLNFIEWVDNECKKEKRVSENPILIDGKPAYEYICNLGKSETTGDILFRTIALEKGEYVYTLINNGYKRDQELDEVFEGVISSYKYN